ncbi:leucyl-tRNA synthetase [Babesia caballi]|uniref:leucine--tRNA ligase n=1 Tax=Babesia caballi TaxID=5871 RepID=A0AAV4LM13_BABCB|nr:leucyl-tRNA synthetase [Babesia caballi]
MSKRAQLLENEALVRQLWQDGHVYDAAVPTPRSAEKYFCTFPYPYMNGRLHIGHAFSMSKAEFQARFQRTQGKAVLWPFGLHCTGRYTRHRLTPKNPGMPIMACADKIKAELAEVKAPVESTPALATPDENATAESQGQAQDKDVTKYTSKKSKLTAKSNVKMTQMDIMRHMGIGNDEIPKFADPQHWLTYFSPLAIQDLQRFGASVDWRRTFITTDRNPYYNKFVEWQFTRMKQLGTLHFGCRPSIFSRSVMQPCADHDRAEGEGATTQEYTVIKMRVEDSPFDPLSSLGPIYEPFKDVLASKQLFLLAATLRPETMYGQTNCFVLPEGSYDVVLGLSSPKLNFNDCGVVETIMGVEEAVKSCDCLYITSARAAMNMAYQGLVLLRSPGSAPSLSELHAVARCSGQELIGAALSSPLSVHPRIYVLPMTTISMEKGTGIVSCVPSDSPDDYITLFEIHKKAAYYKEKYNVDAVHCSLDAVPVIEIPGLGTCAAQLLCQQEKVASNKDSVKLERCKEVLYKRGFYEGIMAVGPYTGRKVSEVKDTIREEMVRSQQAFVYYEPTKRVVARSGDVCIVALCNQWYTKFSDEAWKQRVLGHVSDPSRFTCYSESALNQVKHVVSWLDNWACSRSYGLGTVLPWEDIKQNKNSLIESLSDSTIYMAYYTIAHYLQGDIFGTSPGSLDLQPHQLTPEVFDYVFHLSDAPPDGLDPAVCDKLATMRGDFAYWYPVDLRTSGKDLIFNHLTMSLFVHDAIWGSVKAVDAMPRSYLCVGHILVDAEKMSKSKGNFLTLEDAVAQYTADGTRVALADAGDGLDDANFAKETAETAVLKLHSILLSAQSDMELSGRVCSGSSLSQYAKRVFENELCVLAERAKEAYAAFVYRDALKHCFYDYITARRNYLQMSQGDVDYAALRLYHETFCLIANPIIPHICEYIWMKVLGHTTSLVGQLWPTMPAIDWGLHRYAANFPLNHLFRQVKLLYKNLDDFRKCKEKSQATSRKRQGASPPAEFTGAVVYVAKEYPELHQQVLRALQSMDVVGGSMTEKEVVKALSASELVSAASPADKKAMLAFASFQLRDVAALGASALLLELPYCELSFLRSIAPFVQQSLEVKVLGRRAQVELLEVPTGGLQAPHHLVDACLGHDVRVLHNGQPTAPHRLLRPQLVAAGGACLALTAPRVQPRQNLPKAHCRSLEHVTYMLYLPVDGPQFHRLVQQRPQLLGDLVGQHRQHGVARLRRLVNRALHHAVGAQRDHELLPLEHLEVPAQSALQGAGEVVQQGEAPPRVERAEADALRAHVRCDIGRQAQPRQRPHLCPYRFIGHEATQLHAGHHPQEVTDRVLHLELRRDLSNVRRRVFYAECGVKRSLRRRHCRQPNLFDGVDTDVQQRFWFHLKRVTREVHHACDTAEQPTQQPEGPRVVVEPRPNFPEPHDVECPRHDILEHDVDQRRADLAMAHPSDPPVLVALFGNVISIHCNVSARRAPHRLRL